MTAPAEITGTGLALASSCSPGPLAGLLAGDAGDAGDTGDAKWSVTEAHLSRRGMRFKDRASRLALCAADAALRDAGYLDGECYTGPAARTAVLVSSDLGCLDNVCGALDVLTAGSSAELSPMGMPHTSPNMVAGWIAIQYGLKGPNLTLSNGITGGLDALYWAGNLLAAGRAEVAVVVGVEPDGAAVSRLLSEEGASSWLDGAAAVVLEPGDRAAPARPGRAAVTGYARASCLADAVRSVPSAGARRWVATGPGIAPGIAPGAATGTATGAAPGTSPGLPPPGVPVLDISAQLGRCSGALGVLQCLAAVGILDRDGAGAVLAACGEDKGGPAAALVISSPPGLRAPRDQEPGNGAPGGPPAGYGGAA